VRCFAIECEERGADPFVRLFNEVVLFLVAIGFVVLIVSLCYKTMTSPSATPDEKKWAMSLISAAAGGIIWYLVKR